MDRETAKNIKDIYLYSETNEKDLFNSFRLMMSYDRIRKNHKSFLHRKEVEAFLSKIPLTDPSKIEKNNLTKRAFQQKLASVVIEERERNMKSSSILSQSFPVSLNDYTEYLVDYKSKSLEEFFKTYDTKEIYNFFLKYFGTDMAGNDFRTKSSESPYSSNWKNYKNNVKLKELIQNMTNQCAVQTKHFVHSKVMTVEITNDALSKNMTHYLTIQDMLSIVSHEFGCEPYYVERSVTRPSLLRAHFLFNNYVPDSYKLKLESYFKINYLFEIKIQKDKDYFTLPFSKNILLSGAFDEMSILGVKQETLVESYERITNYFKDSKNENRLRPLENLVGKIRYGEDIEYSYDPDSEDLIDYYGGFSSTNTGYEKFRYGRGTRYKNQVKLSVFCYGKNYTVDEYINLCYSLNDGTSRDMSEWSEAKIRRELTKYYNFASRVADTPVTNQSNKTDNKLSKTLDDSGNRIYCIQDNPVMTPFDSKDIKDKFLYIISYHYDLKYKSARQQGIWKRYFLRDALMLIKFMNRRKLYNKARHKVYVKDKYKKLSAGVILPVTMYRDLKKALRLKTSIKKLVKFLCDIKLIKPIEVDGYEYSHKADLFARHFMIVEKAAIISVYESLIKLIVSTSKVKNNKYNIFYKLNQIKNLFSSDIYYVNYFHSQATRAKLLRMNFSPKKILIE